MRWLFGSKKEINSIKDAKKRILDVPGRGDSVDDAHEILSLASEVAAGSHLGIPEKLDIILFIEAEAHQIFDRLIRGYLMKARLSAPGGVVYEFLQAYVRDASRMYAELGPLCSGQRMRGSMVLALARAMYLLTIGKRLTLMRRSPVSDDVVRAIGNIWKEAHASGVESDRIRLYEDAPESAIEDMLLRSLLLEASGPEGLTPGQIEAADEVLRRFESRFDIGRDASSVFWMDFDGPQGPRRMRENERGLMLGIRFGPGADFEARMSDLMEHLRAGKIPRSMQFDVDINRADLLVVMKHLQQNLGIEAPTRKHDRVGVMRSIEVVGTTDRIGKILNALDQQETRASQDLSYQEAEEIRMYDHLRDQTRQAIQKKKREAAKIPNPIAGPCEVATWETENLSEGGLGAVAPVMDSWIRIGALVAFRLDLEDPFELGVIRRIGVDTESGRIHVGLQIIFADALMAAWLYHATAVVSTDGDSRTPCLLVSSGERQCVILRPGYYIKDKRVRLVAGRNEAVVRFGVSLEKTHDFEMISVVEDQVGR